MGTKQVKMEFQVAANDGALAQVTVTAGGTQVFSGSLAQTENPLPDIVLNDETPFSLVQFELDVPDMPVPTVNPPDSGSTWTTPVDVIISVSGGIVCLQETLANYSAKMIEVTPPTNPATYTIEQGNASTFSTLRFTNQPVWTPTNTDPGRLIFEDNINTGPGSLTIFDNQSVAYQVSMTLYSA
jgi:hypothetical protein